MRKAPSESSPEGSRISGVEEGEAVSKTGSKTGTTLSNNTKGLPGVGEAITDMVAAAEVEEGNHSCLPHRQSLPSSTSSRPAIIILRSS